MTANRDEATIRGFGEEWTAFDQTKLTGKAYQDAFESYFSLLNFEPLRKAEGFDLGCGSGRWATGVAPLVGLLHCIDPSAPALDVARRRLKNASNVQFHLASSDSIPLKDASQDFGYCLGVLHHIPDTERALADCVRKLKHGAPIIVYIYYAMENRPAWYRALWKATDLPRRVISRSPFPVKKALTTIIAGTTYWPLARIALVGETLGVDVKNFPLSSYRRNKFYSMRTDALDRFGTRLEQRFTREETERMMKSAGLIDIQFSNHAPYWVACGHRK